MRPVLQNLLFFKTQRVRTESSSKTTQMPQSRYQNRDSLGSPFQSHFFSFQWEAGSRQDGRRADSPRVAPPVQLFLQKPGAPSPQLLGQRPRRQHLTPRPGRASTSRGAFWEMDLKFNSGDSIQKSVGSAPPRGSGSSFLLRWMCARLGACVCLPPPSQAPPAGAWEPGLAQSPISAAPASAPQASRQWAQPCPLQGPGRCWAPAAQSSPHRCFTGASRQ